eukprot:11038815-Alexandrium_andersonii.AAC.1
MCIRDRRLPASVANGCLGALACSESGGEPRHCAGSAAKVCATNLDTSPQAWPRAVWEAAPVLFLATCLGAALQARQRFARLSWGPCHGYGQGLLQSPPHAESND